MSLMLSHLFITLFRGHPLGNGGDAPNITFGPYTHLHADGEHLLLFLPEGDIHTLFLVGDRIYYNNVLFEDWSAFCGQPEDIEEFDRIKATPQRRQDRRREEDRTWKAR